MKLGVLFLSGISAHDRLEVNRVGVSTPTVERLNYSNLYGDVKLTEVQEQLFRQIITNPGISPGTVKWKKSAKNFNTH